MITFFFLLCCLCNASLLDLKASILEQQENLVARLKAKVLLETGGKSSGISVTGITLLPRKKCCNPYKEPGKYGNIGCSTGVTAKCCTNGEWSCPLSNGDAICNGIRTCGPWSNACEVACCNPFKQPGMHGNPFCLFGAKCCYDGKWSCINPNGTYTCGGSLTTVVGSACLIKCCPRSERPTTCRNPQCCYDGTWACAASDGTYQCGGTSTSITGPFSAPCAAVGCCDPFEEPGTHGNAICFEGHACCPTTWTWVCGSGDGSFPCSGGSACTSLIESRSQLSIGAAEDSSSVVLLEEGDVPVPDFVLVPRTQCCNPWREPGKFGNVGCSSGAAKCCTNGEWSCPLPDGTVVCNGIYTNCPLSNACEVKCCEPQEPGNPTCASGAKCCYTGQWICASPDGTYSCGGAVTSRVSETCPKPALIDTGSVAGSVAALDNNGALAPKGCDSEGQVCGGVAAIPCPQGSTCVDDPNDDCYPKKGGVDCAGICKCADCSTIRCRTVLPCPAWQQYVPTGQCCPQCRTCRNGGTPLATVDCKLMRCPGGYQCEGISNLLKDGTWDRHGLCCQNCPIMDCFPPPNCQFVNPTFDNYGCQTGCGTLNCPCRDGMEYRECGSVCPPTTCANPNPVVCTDRCVGCFCKDGLLLNADNRCVAKELCGGTIVVDSVIPVPDGDSVTPSLPKLDG